MSFLDWRSDWDTGMGEMDRQHQRLVHLINDLHDAMKVGQGAGRVGTVLHWLQDYTETHFQQEEALLRSRKWPGLNRHLVLHHELLDQLGRYVSDHDAGRHVSSLDISDFLRDWLINHIVQEDKQYGAALSGTAV